MKKNVFLTIDDGPSIHTLKKLNFLKLHQIPAILFIRGVFAESHFDMCIEAIRMGFWLGNHSYSHPHFSKISLEEAKSEILKTEEIIDRAYQQAKEKREVKLFRFPFLDKGGVNRTELQRFLRGLGFQKLNFDTISYLYFHECELNRETDVPWTFDAREYAFFSPAYMEKHQLFCAQDVVNLLYRNAPEKGFGLQSPSADIILLHDFESTHHLFEPILNELLKWNISFRLPSIETIIDQNSPQNKYHK